MTKKDYELLAAAIRQMGIRLGESVDDCCGLVHVGRKHLTVSGALADIVGTLCEELERDNPRFNADRFRAACGFNYEM
jgi:hypothetical protein